MKFVILAALVLMPVSLIAFAEGEVAKTAAEKPPVDTIEVTNNNAPGLFERIRGAHLRAVEKGTLAAAVATPSS